MGIHYQTIAFEGKTKDDVTDQVNSWLTDHKGKIQVISSNMMLQPTDIETRFIVYVLYI
jgi:hypothetical protein